MCQTCDQQEQKNAKFWRTVRRALIMIANAIGERYPEHRRPEKAA